MTDDSTTPYTTLDELAERYAVILFDAYGVLAGSEYVAPEAPAAIARLNAIGKPYYVLTNDASALPETRAARYARMGLPVTADRIITSGSLLSAHFADNDLAGARCAVLGTSDSVAYVEIAGGVRVPFGDDFDALVIGDQSGFPFLEASDAVLSRLFAKIDAGDAPRLILPNPDLIYPEGAGFGFASGTVAAMFESALALRYPDRPELRFERLGKPHRAMFAEARRRGGSDDMAMIGDTPETDIRGANAFGISSALIATGIARVDVSRLPESDRPRYLMLSLASSAANRCPAQSGA